MGWFSWTYSGVDFNLDGTGGIDCYNYLSINQKLAETVPAIIIALMQLYVALRTITLPYVNENTSISTTGHAGLRILLLLHAITFGIELGYKFATGTFIWVFNPCHAITLLQLFLLISPPAPIATACFRLMMHMLNGPILALILPVVNTRTMPGEVFIYYFQHILIITLPFFLMARGYRYGVYTTEKLFDISWMLMSCAVQCLYHFVFLQPIACSTTVNLDNMLCPAISDPFRGSYYRVCAFFHQTALVILLGKFLHLLYPFLLGHNPFTESAFLKNETPCSTMPWLSCVSFKSQKPSSENNANGRVKVK